MTTEMGTELGRLNEEQKATVLGWVQEKLSLRAMVELMAKPAPEGFGMVVSAVALEQAIKVWQRAAFLRSLQEEKAHAEEMRKVTAELGEDFRYALQELMEQRLFTEVLRTGEVRWLFRVVKFLEQHDARVAREGLLERRLALAEARRGYNGQKTSMRGGHPEQAGSATDDDGSIEQFWEARRRTYGGDVVDTDGVTRSTLPPMQRADGTLYYGPNGKKDEGARLKDEGPGSERVDHGGTVRKEAEVVSSGPKGAEQATGARRQGEREAFTEVNQGNEVVEAGTVAQRPLAEKGDLIETGAPKGRARRPNILEIMARAEAENVQRRNRVMPEHLLEGVAVVPGPATVDGNGQPVTVRTLVGWVNGHPDSEAVGALLKRVFCKERWEQILRKRELIQIPTRALEGLKEFRGLTERDLTWAADRGEKQ